MIIGILGAPGGGKSTVSGEFGRLGCGVIDADKIVHELLEKDETVIFQLKKAFGVDILSDTGQIDRFKLAGKVFESAGKDAKVLKINEIIHPFVFARTERLLSEFQERTDVKAIVLDMPLLMETGWVDRCDVLVFVECSEGKRALRAHEKGVCYEKKLKKREKFQISLDKKKEMAHYTVDNNSDLPCVVEQVARIFSAMRGD